MHDRTYDNLSDLQIDVLREIGNIGAGNAATALSCMLSERVDMAVPIVKMIDITEMVNILGGLENQVVGILFTLSEDIEGMMMFILEKQFAHLIIKLLMGRDLNTFEDFEEMDLSALQEIGNIMAGSYVNAIAALTSLKIKLSIPDMAIDMVGAILSVPAIKFGAVGDKVMFIEGEYGSGGENVTSYLLLIPEIDSLNKILQVLRMENE